MWAGQPDPIETREALMETSDQDGMALRDLVEAWHELFGPEPHQLSAVLEQLAEPAPSADAERRGALREAITSFCRSDKLTSRLLARRLRQVRGRVVAGLYFEQPARTTRSKKARAWRLLAVRAGGEGDTGGVPGAYA